MLHHAEDLERGAITLPGGASSMPMQRITSWLCLAPCRGCGPGLDHLPDCAPRRLPHPLRHHALQRRAVLGARQARRAAAGAAGARGLRLAVIWGAGQRGGAWLQQVEEHRGTCPIRHRRARRLVAGLLARAGRVDVFGRSFRVAGMVLGTRRGGGQREVTGERERASRACVGGGPGVAQPPPQHGTLPAP